MHGKQMRFMVSAVPFVVALFHLGCAPAIIQNAVVSKLPTFQEASTEFPPLGTDQGRIVVYVTRKNIDLSGTSYHIYIDQLLGIVKCGTFVFADLVSGDHTFTLKRGALRDPMSIDVDLKAGGTLYVKVDAEDMDENPPCVVEEETALIDLKDSHHNYPKVLSLQAWHHNH